MALTAISAVASEAVSNRDPVASQSCVRPLGVAACAISRIALPIQVDLAVDRGEEIDPSSVAE
jgi:hypothetical protein